MNVRVPFTVIFICIAQILNAQNFDLDPDKWAVELSKKDYRASENLLKLDSTIVHADSLRIFQFLDELAKKGASKDYYFQARFNCLKAWVIYFKNVYYHFYQNRKPVNLDLIKAQVIGLLSSAMDNAYRSEDEYLIAFTSSMYAGQMVLFGELGLAVMYSKNSIDLYEKLSYPVLPPQYQFLAEQLYRVREYEQCIRYGKKAVAAWQKSPHEDKSLTINCINTVALGYHRQGKYDSALVFYHQALQLARQTNNAVWIGIVSGNIGQVFYAQGRYDTAYALLKSDYETSKKAGYYDNAGNSLQWAARTNLARGNTGAALQEVREAFQLLRLWPDASYLRNTYYTTTQIFRKMGAYDSAFQYNTLYTTLNDSLEKVVATSSLAISKARLNDERSRYQIQNLNQEKRSQLLFRNIIIAAIVVFALIALLVVNRQRLKEKLKNEKAEQEIASAKEQMRLFTENIIEKTALIERLEGQAINKQVSSEHQTIISELSHKTILTEEDWTRFKALFEKIYPVFFIKLKEAFPDITLAEQRMSALIRLHLTTKQIASMLGISVESVHKTRQRLRQRLQLSTDASLEESIASI